MHLAELFRLWRIYPHPAPDKRACRSSGGVCEADSTSLRSSSHFSPGCIIRCKLLHHIMQRYRSGHNGADSKSVCAKSTRGFESLPLRQRCSCTIRCDCIFLLTQSVGHEHCTVRCEGSHLSVAIGELAHQWRSDKSSPLVNTPPSAPKKGKHPN